MNTRIFLCLAVLGLAAGPVAAQTRGRLELPDFPALADKASESVVVTLDQKLLGLGCKWLSEDDPEEARVKRLCTSLTGIYVRNFTFDDDYSYPKADIDTLLLISSNDVGQRAIQHRNVIEAANKAGVKWLVYTSLLSCRHVAAHPCRRAP